MYQQVASKLYVQVGHDQFSQAVSMDGANAVMFEVTAISSSGASPLLTVQLQESNDLQNWEDVSGAQVANLSAPGYDSDSTAADVAAAYVRLKYTISEGDDFTVASGINTANL
jgi:hypothetical protein